MFQLVKDLESFQNQLAQDKMAVVVFTSHDCGVCHVVKDKVGQVMLEIAPTAQLYHISLPDLPQAAGAYMVFSVPVVLGILDGKEVLREAGIISIPDLEDKLIRAFNLSTDGA